MRTKFQGIENPITRILAEIARIDRTESTDQKTYHVITLHVAGNVRDQYPMF